VSKKIQKIVIVGGGSAGWMSASTMINEFPNHDITLIESPNIPTVGVGESTIGGIRDWLNLLGIKEKDFIPFTDASFKLSIRFTDFYRKDAGSFHYPFGIPQVNGNLAKKNDWYFKKMYHPDTPVSDYAECMYPQMALVMQNKISDNHNMHKFPGFFRDRDTAYHFDSTKFGLWLSEHYAKPRGVKHIIADVTDISVNDSGIEYLELSTGEKITADLFIDCTGFKSMLLGDALKEPFTSYEHMLPNNSAWATRIPYTDKEKQLEAFTDCHAIENGWVWNIPLWSRLGKGYVYSDKHVSDANALEEFKNHLKEKEQYSDDLEFKNIKMRIGIHERLYVKNVCAIGLSAGFIEPLESTGLFTTHEFLIKLVRSIHRDNYVSRWDKDTFNSICKKQFHDFAEFVAMHYSLSHRDDTAYWRDVGEREYFPDMINQRFRPYHSVFLHAITERMQTFFYEEQASGVHCILTGMNYFPADRQTVIPYSYPSDTNWKEYFEPSTQNLEQKKQHWAKLAEDEPTLYQYLKENYYPNES